MKTLKLFSLSLLLSLAGIVYAAGTQTPAQTAAAAKPSCCAAAASCCADGAACCKADKEKAGCCADGVCEMHARGAGHHAKAGDKAAAPAIHAGSQHAAHGGRHEAHAQGGAADSCSADGCCCCAGHGKAEGQPSAADGDCCKMHGDKAHAAHTQHAAAAGGEQSDASCCSMHKAGAAGAKDAKSCCAPGAACCAANAACCAAAARANKQ